MNAPAGTLVPFSPETQAEPRLWEVFRDISAIPRLSGNEDGVCRYLTKWAVRFPGVRVTADAHGNISVCIPGKGARKDAAEFLLQSHMDMVGIKEPDKAHDFATDGIALFTDGEETDNEPALNFDPKFHGIDRPIPYIVSLDGNTEGHVGIYCAGYQDIKASITLAEDTGFSYAGGQTYRLDVNGKNHRGGHSGLTAHLGLPSATRTLLKGVLPLLPPGSRLMQQMSGGEGKTSWPKAASATVWIPDTPDTSWRERVATYLREAANVGEDALSMHLVERAAGAVRADVHDDLMRLFSRLPDGAAAIAPHGMQASLSSNFGSVDTIMDSDGPPVLEMGMYVRGDAEEQLREHGLAIQQILEEAHARVTAGPVVAGCFTPPDAPLIQAALAATAEASGGAGAVGGHCFVEVGAIRNKLAALHTGVTPQATVLPIATISDEHTTREKASIASASRLLKALRGTYDRLTTA